MVGQHDDTVEVITLEDEEIEIIYSTIGPGVSPKDRYVEVITENNFSPARMVDDDDDDIELVKVVPVITLDDSNVDPDIIILDEASIINSSVECNHDSNDIQTAEAERGDYLLNSPERSLTVNVHTASVNSNGDASKAPTNVSLTEKTLNDSASISPLPSPQVSFHPADNDVQDDHSSPTTVLSKNRSSNDLSKHLSTSSIFEAFTSSPGRSLRSAGSPLTALNTSDLPSIHSNSINVSQSSILIPCSSLDEYSFLGPSTSKATDATNSTKETKNTASDDKPVGKHTKGKNKKGSKGKKASSNSRSRAANCLYQDSGNDDYFQSDVYKKKPRSGSVASDWSFNGGGSLLDGLSDLDREDSTAFKEWKDRSDKMETPIYPPSSESDDEEEKSRRNVEVPMPPSRKMYPDAYLRKMTRESNPLSVYARKRKAMPQLKAMKSRGDLLSKTLDEVERIKAMLRRRESEDSE